MSEEVKNEEKKQENIEQEVQKAIKGLIIHFPGEEPSAIHLKNVERLRRVGNTILFDCAYKSYPYPFSDEATAESARQTIMNVWAENLI